MCIFQVVLSIMFSSQSLVWIFLLLFMPCPLPVSSFWFDHPNVWWGVQNMRLIIVSLYSASIIFAPRVPEFLLSIHFLVTLSVCVLLVHFLKPLHRTTGASRETHIEMCFTSTWQCCLCQCWITFCNCGNGWEYCAGGKIEKNEMGGACGVYGGRRGVYRVLVLKPEGKRPLGRPRHRWEGNIKMDLQEVGGGC